MKADNYAETLGELDARTVAAVSGRPLAVIDLGAYSARLEIVQVHPDGATEVLENLSQPLPLGHDVFNRGRIRPASIRLAERVLLDFAQLMKEYRVEQYRAIATSAVRESFNRDIFLQRMRHATGLNITTLEEQEEARMIFLSVKKALRKRHHWTRGNALIFTIGTGSTQLCFMQEGRVTSVDTIRLGTLRLVEEEMESQINPRRLQEVVDPFIAGIFSSVDRMASHAHPDRIIAVGAPVRALTRLDRSQPARHVARMTRSRFSALFARVTEMSVAELIKHHGFRDPVAQSLEPCCHMLENLFDIVGTDHMLIPMVNTRDAIFEDLFREICQAEDPFLPEIISAATSMGDRFRSDRTHARHVADLALTIFDALQDAHRLSRRSRLLLEVAALLHEVGLFVSSRAHHKHSYYLIRNSELPGIRDQELEVIATIARYHRRAIPSRSHLEYMSLSPDERVRVIQLAAILRVADALDRSHQCRVRNLTLHTDGDRLLLDPGEGQDLTLEAWGLRGKGDLFREAFGFQVALIGYEYE